MRSVPPDFCASAAHGTDVSTTASAATPSAARPNLEFMYSPSSAGDYSRSVDLMEDERKHERHHSRHQPELHRGRHARYRRGLRAAAHRRRAAHRGDDAEGGSAGIETQQHVDSVVVPLTKTVASFDGKYDAFVIACYSDPGLHSVREATRKPVLGIAE